MVADHEPWPEAEGDPEEPMCAVCGVHVDLTLNSALDAVEDKGWPWVHSEIDDE